MGAEASELLGLSQAYETASGRVGRAGRQAIQEQANETKQLQQQLAPVRTGELRAAITVRMGGDGRSSEMSAEIGPMGESRGHGYFVEHGTARMAAQPFVEPATQAADQSWPGRVEEMMADVTADL